MNKFSLIPKKFNKKISVADIKQYLVDEFNTNNKLQTQVYELQDKLKVTKEYEVKYNLSLATLDEYKSRIEKVNARNKQLENQIEECQNTIKEQSYEIANLKLENKKMEDYTNKIKDNVKKEFIQEYKNKISNLKGHIKKDDLLNMRW